ncbi:MAG: hypothetical protein ACYCUW_10920 [bacterium]
MNINCGNLSMSKEKRAGQFFYTPRCIVQLLVFIIEPFKCRVMTLQTNNCL